MTENITSDLLRENGVCVWVWGCGGGCACSLWGRCLVQCVTVDMCVLHIHVIGERSEPT